MFLRHSVYMSAAMWHYIHYAR